MPIETITLDNGSEFADFLNIEKDLGTTIYFADLHSPWQRGLNENTMIFYVSSILRALIF